MHISIQFLRRTVSVIILGLISVYSLKAQTQKELQDAFTKSYTQENNKSYEDAIKTLNAVYSDKNYEVNLRLGWLNYLAGKNDKAIAHYKICIKLMPSSTEAHWGIINPYSLKEDWVSVEKTYLSILKLDPKNSKANYSLGLIYYYRKNYTTAKKYFDVALNLYPFDYNSLLMSAWTSYFLGRMQDAKVLFNKVLLNQPNDASALEGLSLIK